MYNCYLTWHSGVSCAEEPKCAHAVVYRHHNDTAAIRHLFAIIQRVAQEADVVGGPQKEGTPEDVDHHRQPSGH